MEDGVGASVLKQFGLDMETIRAAVANLVLPGDDAVVDPKPLRTPRAKKCIEVAMRLAITHKQDYVGTAHLTVGLLSDPESVAYSVLQSANGSMQAMREHLQVAIFSPAELFPNDRGPRPE